MTGFQVLSCGPYFQPAGMITSLVIFLLIKPYAYFAFIQAYRYRVSREIPMTTKQAIKLALLRALLGVVLVGGGAFVLTYFSLTGAWLYSWVYMYFARLVSWWFVGYKCAGIKGVRLVGWIVFGTLINIAFDGAVVVGLATGWFFPALIILGISIFIFILHKIGQRPYLQARFADYPLCTNCQYNLTGNLSGICPECGTPIQPILV